MHDAQSEVKIGGLCVVDRGQPAQAGLHYLLVSEQVALCIGYWVLCTVYCVLCTVYCVLCTVYCDSVHFT